CIRVERDATSILFSPVRELANNLGVQHARLGIRRRHNDEFLLRREFETKIRIVAAKPEKLLGAESDRLDVNHDSGDVCVIGEHWNLCHSYLFEQLSRYIQISVRSSVKPGRTGSPLTDVGRFKCSGAWPCL